MDSAWANALEQERRAQDIFTDLLTRSPQQAWDEIEAIRGGLVAERILFGDKPIPLIFAPVVLSRYRWESLANSLAVKAGWRIERAPPAATISRTLAL